MNFQCVVDSIAAQACVISVEKKEDGGYGKICIETGNKAYVESIEKPKDGVEMLVSKFVPGQEYTTYLERDLNFEEFCYLSAIKKKSLHTYVHPERFPVWFNITVLPLGPDEGNKGFCLYTMEVDLAPDSKEISNVSSDIASAVLKTCIQLRGTSDFEKTMKDIIKDIRDLCEAEHCCILLMDTQKRSCWVLCEEFGPNTKLLPMEHYVDDAFYDIAESWISTIAGSNCIIAKNDADMEVVKERNPVWYESLTQAGANSIVLFPIRFNEELMGYIWAINFEAKDTTKIKETLELTTFILGTEIANNRLVQRLKILSSKDMLTGVNNRNEMNTFVDRLSSQEDEDTATVGVVFADLNGLKNLNDAKGHVAGDLLLKNAARALKGVFDDECIFRAGGDEFSVIIPGIKEDELEDCVRRLRDSSVGNGIYFALGYSFEESSKNVRKALRAADERMYEDKAKFYAKNPDMVRITNRDRFHYEHG